MTNSRNAQVVSKMFRTLLDDINTLWQKMDVRTSSGTQLNLALFVYEPSCMEEIVKLGSFKKLILKLKKEVSFIKKFLYDEECLTDALKDFLLIATRREGDKENYFDEPVGYDEAIRLLLEDIYMEVPPNRGFAWIYGIRPESLIIDLNERFRIRRASRFEIRAFQERDKHSVWDWEVQERSLLPIFYPAVRSAYMIEIKMEPNCVPSLILQEEREHLNANLVQEVVSCMRLLWNAPFSLSSKYFVTQSEPNISSTGIQIANEYISSQLPVKSIRRMEHSTNWFVPPIIFGEDEKKRFREFWDAFLKFKGKYKQQEIGRDFERACVRYNQSYIETYTEDIVLDLALSLEAITRTSGSNVPYLAAVLSSPVPDISETQKIFADFYKLRNIAAHGANLDYEDMNLINVVKDLVQSCLRHAVFVVEMVIGKKHTLRRILDESLMSCSKRREMQKRIPVWSLKT